MFKKLINGLKTVLLIIKNSFKGWAINKLGGYTEQEAEFIRLGARQKALNDFSDSVNVVFSQVDMNEYPSLQNNPKDKCYELTCRQLGKAVYPYAEHIYAENGLYTATVQVLRYTK